MRPICLGFLLLLSVSTAFADDPPPSRQLEEEIESLKGDILKEKMKLRQLEEAVLLGKLTSTFAFITLRNESATQLQLLEGEFLIDQTAVAHLSGEPETKVKEKPVAEKSGAAAAPSRLVFEDEVPPGEHVLAVKLRFRGRRKGPFTYMEDYTFRLEAEKAFPLTQGKSTAIEVVVTDRGVVTEKLEDRFAVSFHVVSGT